MVKVADEPDVMVSDFGVAVSKKSPGLITFNVAVAVRTICPEVPPIVILKVDSGVSAVVFNVRVTLPAGTIVLDEKPTLILLPGGEMDTLKLTGCVKPSNDWTSIMKLVDVPDVTV
jgi:hypothetical protein